MTDPDHALNYYERITCSVQWRAFGPALAAELAEGLPQDELRALFFRIGQRVASGSPLAKVDTVLELQSAFNAHWSAVDWGFTTLQETDEHLVLTHDCSPLAMAFGPPSLAWTAGFFEGAYQTWFVAQGIPRPLRVRADDAATPSSRVVLKLGRFAA